MVNRAGRGHGWKPLRVHLGICIVRSAIRHFKIDLTLADLCGLLEEVRDTPAACRSRKALVLLILQRAVCNGNRARAKLPWGSGTGLEKCQARTESRLRILIQQFRPPAGRCSVSNTQLGGFDSFAACQFIQVWVAGIPSTL